MEINIKKVLLLFLFVAHGQIVFGSGDGDDFIEPVKPAKKAAVITTEKIKEKIKEKILTNTAQESVVSPNKLNRNLEIIKTKSKALTKAVYKGILLTDEKYYYPYAQIGGTRYFRASSLKNALNADFFIPLWQRGLNYLFFGDLRINDYNGPAFEGNIHFGYRQLFGEDDQLLGFYGAFDRRKSQARNFFSQVTLGAEYWYKRFFVGGNFYKPFGSTSKFITNIEDYSKVWNNLGPDEFESYVGVQSGNENAMTGADAEVGYEFIDGLVGYVGGYSFGFGSQAVVSGPKVRITYDWALKDNKRIFGIFDKVGLETGLQTDQKRGGLWYISLNTRIGYIPKDKVALRGVSRHMIDQVRRDPDVVVSMEQAPVKEELQTLKITESPEDFVKAVMEGKHDFVYARCNLDEHNLIEAMSNHKGRIVTIDEVYKELGERRVNNTDKKVQVTLDGKVDTCTKVYEDGSKHYETRTFEFEVNNPLLGNISKEYFDHPNNEAYRKGKIHVDTLHGLHRAGLVNEHSVLRMHHPDSAVIASFKHSKGLRYNFSFSTNKNVKTDPAGYIKDLKNYYDNIANDKAKINVTEYLHDQTLREITREWYKLGKPEDHLGYSLHLIKNDIADLREGDTSKFEPMPEGFEKKFEVK